MTTVRPRIDLVPVAPGDDSALRAWFDLETATLAVDRPYDPPPCWRQRRVALSAPWPGARLEVWLARDGDQTVGYATLGLPTLDNLDSSFSNVCVAPAHRRAGIGTALVAHLVDRARAAGRVRTWLEVCATPAAGPAFAASTGAAPALAEQRQRLILPADEDTLAALGAQARAAATGYELVQWVGAAPQAYVDDLAHLTGRMSVDAPLGDLHVEPTRYDPARIRAREAAQAARGALVCTTGAVHTTSRRMVAYSDIAVAATVPEHGWQCDTLVEPAHRGHRLGLLVKLANLEVVCRERPALRAITTWNADANAHMVAINEAMGFRPLDAWTEWELDLSGYPGSTGAMSAAAAGP